MGKALQLSSIAILGIALLGCGPGNPAGRVAVSGQVTLDGAPIDEGTIEFAPVDQNLGSGAKIVAGKYAIETHRGLPPGKYTVRVFAPKLPAGAKAPDPNAPPGPPGPESNFLGVERVAPRFNIKSELVVEVPSGGQAQVFDFAVSGK